MARKKIRPIVTDANNHTYFADNDDAVSNTEVITGVVDYTQPIPPPEELEAITTGFSGEGCFEPVERDMQEAILDADKLGCIELATDDPLPYIQFKDCQVTINITINNTTNNAK